MKGLTGKKINFAIICILTFAIGIMVNYISFRQYRRFDLTRSMIFSLSTESKKVIARIKKPLNIIVFMSNNNVELYEQIKELLESYKNNNANIKIEYINPLKDYEKTQKISRKFNLRSPDVVVFEYENRNKFVTYSDIVEYEYIYGSQPKITNFKGENNFTNAILSLLEEQKTTVYFTAGHGERKLSSPQEEEAFGNLDSLKGKYLEKKNFTVKEIQTLTSTAIPEDCSLLAIIAPQLDFNENEIRLLSGYAARGGKFLFCLEPSPGLNQRPDQKFIEFVKTFGIKFIDQIIIDPENAFPLLGRACFAVLNYYPSVITADLKDNNIPLLFTTCGAFSTEENEKYKADPLLMTGGKSYAISGIENINNESAVSAGDTRQSYTIAYHIQSKNLNSLSSAVSPANETASQKSCEAIIIGDADFTGNLILQQSAGNPLFILNIVNYLTGRKDLISLPPKSPEKMELTLASSELSRIFIFTILAMPLCAVVAGIGIWLKRRK